MPKKIQGGKEKAAGDGSTPPRHSNTTNARVLDMAADDQERTMIETANLEDGSRGLSEFSEELIGKVLATTPATQPSPEGTPTPSHEAGASSAVPAPMTPPPAALSGEAPPRAVPAPKTPPRRVRGRSLYQAGRSPHRSVPPWQAASGSASARHPDPGTGSAQVTRPHQSTGIAPAVWRRSGGKGRWRKPKPCL